MSATVFPQAIFMPARHACPMPYTIPEGRRGPTPGAGLQELSGVPLILRAMLDDDERVWR